MAVQRMFLVVLAHSMDDVPLRLCGTREEADAVASKAEWSPPDGIAKGLRLPDMSTPCNIAIITFRDGYPVSRDIVRDYETEGDEVAA